MAGSVTINGLLTGTSVGTVNVGPYTLTPNVSEYYQADEYTLASGSNTITIPSWATTTILVPPSSNAQTLEVAGVAVSETAPCLFSWSGSPPSTLTVTAGGSVAGYTAQHT